MNPITCILSGERTEVVVTKADIDNLTLSIGCTSDIEISRSTLRTLLAASLFSPGWVFLHRKLSPTTQLWHTYQTQTSPFIRFEGERCILSNTEDGPATDYCFTDNAFHPAWVATKEQLNAYRNA